MSSISTQNASSLLSFSSSTPQWKYDVFLSFRGEDTYNSFTDHLYVALKQKGIFIFRDEEKIKRGKSISPEFLKAIEESRSVIVCVVFCSHPHHQIPNGDSLSCWLVANGKKCLLHQTLAILLFYWIISGYFICFLNTTKRNK